MNKDLEKNINIQDEKNNINTKDEINIDELDEISGGVNIMKKPPHQAY